LGEGICEKMEGKKEGDGGSIWQRYIVYMYENVIMKPLFCTIKR
jgi:hypothetical protein